MPGPVSLPDGDRRRFEELNELVCDRHFHGDCAVDEEHDVITYREWLHRRNRLRTGKTK